MQIGNLMLDQGDWSAELLKQILQVSMDSIRTNLSKIDKGGGQFGITTTSLRDAIDKNAAGNQREISRLNAQAQQEVEKILLEYHYVETAIKGFSGRLAQMGILSESAESLANRLSDAEIGKYESNKADMLRAFIQSGSQKYRVNPEDSASLSQWLSEFTGAQGGFNGFSKPFADDFKLWLSDSKLYKTEIQAFYLSLVKSEDEYYEAMKKARDKQKALFEQRMEKSGMRAKFDLYTTDLGNRSRELKRTGSDQGTTFGMMGGFDNLTEDPELAASMLRMEQARRELEEFKQTAEQKKLVGEELAAFQQNLREKEMAATQAEIDMQDQLMTSINARIDKMQQWTDPINEFAIAIGDAAGTAIRDSQSMAEQVQDALKNMVKAYGDSTIKIISELMMQRVKKRMLGKAMAKETKDVQTEETNITEQGGKERLNAESIVQTGIASITQQMGQQILATKQQQDTQETQMEGQKARGGIMAGIAEGAAKIIGSLGWWGIPLIAVITALLNGLLNMALSALFGGNSSSSTSTNSAASKVKLASGMLTYDEGNIGTYQGSDGQSYRAAAVSAPGDGLVTRPIATTVQGQPALVAERGPEIVIGRRTTKAIMMNEPGLIRYLANYNKNASAAPRYRAFDEGNLDTINGPWPMDNGQSSMVNGQLTREDAAALTAAIGVFNQTVVQLQQKGIPCYINKYGTGGLIDEVKSGLKFDAKYNGK